MTNVQSKNVISEIDNKLSTISKIFNINKILKMHIGNKEIKKYYTLSNLGYRYFHSRDGAVHMALNFDGEFNSKGYLGQAQIIDDYINRNNYHDILELASGKGFNSSYLAKKDPNSIFKAVDITPKYVKISKKMYQDIRNLEFKHGDFNSIPFEDNCFNLVFEVESICHSTNMKESLSEVYRVLKPNGLFISFDGFHSKDISKLDNKIQTASRLIEITMAVNNGLFIKEWLEIAESVGLKKIKCEDISDAIKPNLRRFENMAIRFFNKKFMNKLIHRLSPKLFINNVIAGYLMISLINAGILGYYLTIYQKQK